MLTILSTDEHPVQGPVYVKSTDQLAMSWLALLMQMLSHPVVKRSQQLTDRMLRLLSQIGRNIASPTSSSKQSTGSGEGGTSSSSHPLSDSNPAAEEPSSSAA